MPALVEIEVLRRDLEKEVVGRRIKDVDVRATKNAMKVIPRHGRRKEFQQLLVGAKVERIDRKGKLLLLELDNGNVMLVDLGATGQLLKTSASGDVATHTHIVLGFTIGGQLRLVDPKHQSEVFVTPKEDLDSLPELKQTGIDPLEQQVTWQHFSTLLEEREMPMKQLLMDETFVVGLDDIYSDEILFTAGIRHDRLSTKLSSQDVRRLYRALIETLQDALKARGTTWGPAAFVDLQGTEGQYQMELKVYERDGEPCRRCRSTIVREEVKGRYTTYFCPQCQT